MRENFTESWKIRNEETKKKILRTRKKTKNKRNEKISKSSSARGY